jgi:hypothetical protein
VPTQLGNAHFRDGDDPLASISLGRPERKTGSPCLDCRARRGADVRPPSSLLHRACWDPQPYDMGGAIDAPRDTRGDRGVSAPGRATASAGRCSDGEHGRLSTAYFLEKLNGIVNALEPCRCPGPMQQSSLMGRYSSDPPGLRFECNLRAALTLRARDNSVRELGDRDQRAVRPPVT